MQCGQPVGVALGSGALPLAVGIGELPIPAMAHNAVAIKNHLGLLDVDLHRQIGAAAGGLLELPPRRSLLGRRHRRISLLMHVTLVAGNDRNWCHKGDGIPGAGRYFLVCARRLGNLAARCGAAGTRAVIANGRNRMSTSSQPAKINFARRSVTPRPPARGRPSTRR